MTNNSEENRKSLPLIVLDITFLSLPWIILCTYRDTSWTSFQAVVGFMLTFMVFSVQVLIISLNTLSGHLAKIREITAIFSSVVLASSIKNLETKLSPTDEEKKSNG